MMNTSEHLTIKETTPNTIDLNDLNQKQKESVLSDHPRLLVIAGAGAGKTKTLINKILYLIFEKNVDPASILAITFTRNAANEMIDRLIMYSDKSGHYKKIIENKKNLYENKDRIRKEYIKKYKWLSNLTIKTFHSFCYSLLRNHGAKNFDNRFKLLVDKNIIDESIDDPKMSYESPKQIVNKLLKDLSNDNKYLLSLKQHILDYYVDKLHKVKDKSQYPNGLLYTTLRGEKVRSKSERLIADWFYRHEIDYLYEPKVNFTGDFTFNPDFFIPEAGVYIEHLTGLSYSTKDKEEQFRIGEQTLYKTYENMTHDIRSFYSVLESFVQGRINKKIKAETILKFEDEFRSYAKELNIFIDEALRVIDKIKVVDLDSNDIFSKGKTDKHDRVSEFYRLLEPLYLNYRAFCVENSYLDFNDLILEANSALNEYADIKEFYRNKFKYILIDEFQDVNSLQVKLTNHLLKDETNLFCVGDDWQSIYGFRGSDVGFIIDFEKHYDNSKIIRLDINYRSNDTIVKASNNVISHNKFKIQKEIKSFNSQNKKINLYLAQSEEEDGVDRVCEKITQLSDQGYPKEEILVLYRRRFVFAQYSDKLKQLKNKFTYRTVHASKGLEAKFVFIIGLTGSDYGFPFLMESDRIHQIFKPVNANLLLEEERRLFYVAMTRAREQLFLIAEKGNESEFIKEITDEYLDRENFMTLEFDTEVHICSNCGYELHSIFKFCPICGTPTSITVRKEELTVAEKTNIQTDKAVKPVEYKLSSKWRKFSLNDSASQPQDIKRLILCCLEKVDGQVGRTMLTNILRGKITKKIEELPHLKEFKEFECLANFSKSDVLDKIDRLIDDGMIEKYKIKNMPLLKITKAGYDYLSLK